MELLYIEQITQYFDENQEKIVETENEYLENMDHYKDIWTWSKHNLKEFDRVKEIDFNTLSTKIKDKFNKDLYETIDKLEDNIEILEVRYELMKAEVERISETMEVINFTAYDGKQYFLNEETNYIYSQTSSAIVGKYDDDTGLVLYKLYSKVRGR
tara:strand:- start:14 stop:481 length:468 start_codon:yes stop_codon:yes gene_type:complete